MQRSPIEWTNFTSNPLRYRDVAGSVVHACIHASPGCMRCYSETMAGRWGRAGKKFTAPNMAELTPFLDEDEIRRILTYKPAAGKMCFLGDMTDIFGEWVPDDLLNRLFSNCLEVRTDVTFQILTKRADRMQRYLSWRWGEGRIPMRNIWVGVSVENQEYADKRIPLLLETPAAKRFVSYEPALGPVDFTAKCPPFYAAHLRSDRISWVIVGGESGPGARPFNIEWARSVAQQCKVAGVACFVKQLGAKPHDGNYYKWTPEDGHFEPWLDLKSSKGGDMSEWPEYLRVREFPEVT